MRYFLLLRRQLQYLLYKGQDNTREHFVIQEMLALEEPHLPCSIVLLEIRLTVYQLVLSAEQSPHQLFLLWCDALEGTFLNLLKLADEWFVHLKVCSAILTFVPELTPSQTTERKQTSHVEGGIHQNTGDAP